MKDVFCILINGLFILYVVFIFIFFKCGFICEKLIVIIECNVFLDGFIILFLLFINFIFKVFNIFVLLLFVVFFLSFKIMYFIF